MQLQFQFFSELFICAATVFFLPELILHKYSVEGYVDDIKLTGKQQNINPMWTLLNKEVDLGEPTSFLDHVYLGCTQKKHKMK